MSSWRQVILLSSASIAIFLSRLAPQYLYGDSVWKTASIIFVLQAVAYLTYSIIIYPILLTPLRKLPQPSGGSLLMGQFGRIQREPTGEPMKEWAATIPNQGLIYYRTIFNTSRVFPTSPKALAEVLTTKSYEFVKPYQLREGLGRILGVGILLAEGDEHKRQRKHLTPAFAFRHVKDLYPVFWTKAIEMVQAMNNAITTTSSSDAEKPSNVIEVGEWASRTALDIIGVAGMGQDFNAIEAPSNELYQTYNRIFRPTRAARILGLLSVFLPPWLLRAIPIKRNDDMRQASKTIKRVAYDLIQQKKVKLAKRDATDVDILSVALESGGFSDEDLVNQLMTFLAAGHETTASSMNWAILQLCQKPKVQKRLREELRTAGIKLSLLGDSNAVTGADLEKVPYLSAVCQEVLRLNPPVPMTLRQAASDTTILDQFIPKGTTIILSPLAINQSTELWGPDAATFNPDRWMGVGEANRGGAKSNYAFMTFLHGPRSCIGSAFAKAEFMCLLAAWVLAFDTELEDPDRVIEIQGGVTSKPKGGLRVKLTPTAS